ncbi:MAG: APC family permease [Phycisphaerales bacterium]
MATTNPAPGDQPARVLGLRDATAVVVGAIIGVGIFFNPAGVARLTESSAHALAAWALAGVIALCGGLTFAALGQRYHANGAQYHLLRDAYGPLSGFLFVFCNATAIQGGAIGVIAFVCAANLLTLAGIESAAGGSTTLIVALVLIVLVVLGNVVGVRSGARIQNLTVAAKVTVLLAIVALAFVGPPGGFASSAPLVSTPGTTPLAAPAQGSGFSGIIAALVPAFFAYGGWQHSLWISGEVRDPVRILPRAIIIGVLIVVAVYLSANWAYLALLGHHGVAASKALAADAVATVLPEGGRRAIAAAVAISALGVLNAQLLSGPRLIYGMAVDGRFFKPFARLDRRFHTPSAAIVLLGLTGAALLLTAGAGGIDTLTAGAVFVDGIFFVLTGVALLRMSSAGQAPLLPGAKVAATVFVLGELGVLTGAFLAESARAAAWGGLAWIAGAAVVYSLYFRAPRAG